MSGQFTSEINWVAPKAVLKDYDGYPEIVPGLDCAIGIQFKTGMKYFIMERLELTNGKIYILERYKTHPATVIYKRVEK